MTIIDDRTTRLNLPLPNENNELQDDVFRLREAIENIDTFIWDLDNAADLLNGPQIADCNTIVKTGFYSTNDGPNNRPPAFVSAAGDTVIHFNKLVNGTLASTQFYISRTGRFWFRYQTTGAAWASWIELWTASNLTKQSNASDATNGRVMTVGAFGLGAQVPPEITDWNNATRNGWYLSTVGALNVPKAAAGWQGIVSSLNSENVRQLVWNSDGPAVEMYSRCGDGPTLVWSPWDKLLTTEGTNLGTSLAVDTSLTVNRKSPVTKAQVNAADANATVTIATGFKVEDCVELSVSVAKGRVVTINASHQMDVVGGTTGASHTVTGPAHMNIAMVFSGSKWYLTAR